MAAAAENDTTKRVRDGDKPQTSVTTYNYFVPSNTFNTPQPRESNEPCNVPLPRTPSMGFIQRTVQQLGAGAALLLPVVRNSLEKEQLAANDSTRAYFAHVNTCPMRHPWWVRLACNQMFPPPSRPLATFLLGPVSYYYLTYNKQGVHKEVYLFGELHNSNMSNTRAVVACPGYDPRTSTVDILSIFLTRWLKTSVAFIDLFIENPRGVHRFELEDSFMNDTAKKLRPCIVPDKRSCYYESVRVHAIDWPVLRYAKNPLGAAHVELQRSMQQPAASEIQAAVESEVQAAAASGIQAALERFRGAVRHDLAAVECAALDTAWAALHEALLERRDKFELSDAALTEFQECFRVSMEAVMSSDGVPPAWSTLYSPLVARAGAELDRLRKNIRAVRASDPGGFADAAFSRVILYWASTLSVYMSRYLSNLYALLLHMDAATAPPTFDTVNPLVDAVAASLRTLIILFGSIFVDLYGMARMLKRFNFVGREAFGPAYAYNIIMVAGDKHIQRMKNTLISLGFELQAEAWAAEDEHGRRYPCIPLAAIKDTLFFPHANQPTWT